MARPGDCVGAVACVWVLAEGEVGAELGSTTSQVSRSGPSLSGRRVAWLERRNIERRPDMLLRRVSRLFVEMKEGARAVEFCVEGGLAILGGNGGARAEVDAE